MAEQKGIVCKSVKGRSLDTDSIQLGSSQTEQLEETREFFSLMEVKEVEKKKFAKGHEYSRFGVLVVGKTGTGKSRLINNIFAEYVAKEGDNLDSETEGIVKHKGQVRGSEVIVYDTQGLADSKSTNDEQILEEIGKLIDSNQIDLTVISVSMKFPRLDRDIKQTFIELNRIGLNWKNTVIVLTFADEFHIPPDKKRKGMRAEYFPEKVTEWKESIQKELKESVGLPPEVADGIAVYPATCDYDEPLPSKEDWFSPLWLGILKALPNNSVLQFMRMHQENFAKEHHIPQLEGIQEELDVGLQEREVQRLPALDQPPQDQRPQDQQPQDQQPQDQQPQDQQEAENQLHQRPNINVDEQTLWDIIKEKFGAAGKQVWRWIQRHILRRERNNPDEEQPNINV